ncbi:hypothetical protein [Schaalia vaccimaxillae]|uniref:hypothetical protein n=1 Tax=Schaalia vaccimaxillae TaxID=183916 RepID=UPI0003B4A914|nr:hypothetical protein [Schaalia vaccimaxillae]
MSYIVKSDSTPTAAWQPAVDTAAVLSLVVMLSILGIFASISVGSTASAVVAAVVGLSALVFAPAVYTMIGRSDS